MSQLELKGRPKQILTLAFSPCSLTCSWPAYEIAVPNSHPAQNFTHLGTGQGEVTMQIGKDKSREGFQRNGGWQI